MKRAVIGMLAHVDSGKTTLTEALLYAAGTIRRQGRVDNGDAFLDTDQTEKSRGITIYSKQAVLETDRVSFTLLDTPGHVDFSTEAERSINAMDYAILLISGTDGVRSHTETLWKLLKQASVPVFIFVNKTDQSGFDKRAVMASLKKELNQSCVDFCAGEHILFEEAALCSEELMGEYLETGSLEISSLSQAIDSRQLFPCFFGSALKNTGIKELLSALEEYVIPKGDANGPFAARVFKISSDEQGARLTNIKILSGRLEVRQTVNYTDSDGNEISEKVTALRRYSGSKFRPVEEALPGMTVSALGLSKTYSGQGLGLTTDCPPPALEPVLSYRVDVKDNDPTTVYTLLCFLADQDPQLNVRAGEGAKNIEIGIMGQVQLEVLKARFLTLFGKDIDFTDRRIAYRETITQAVYGYGHFEPLRHYAEVHLFIEPLPRGSGIMLASSCSEDILDKNWQRLILGNLRAKQHVGCLTGSPLTDIKITLVSGKAHLKHTEGGDFREAALRALHQGIRSTAGLLLEPFYNFKIKVPREYLGKVMTDLYDMGAKLSSPEEGTAETLISGTAPADKIGDYQLRLVQLSKGSGSISLNYAGYQPCADPQRVIAERNYDCDRDLINTADSVFCSHGAGHTVRWFEAESHMHMPTHKKEALEQEPTVTPRKSQRYADSLMQDAELIKIFERTYGPVNRDIRSIVRRSHEDSFSVPISVTQTTEYLLVDGYNIIFGWEELAKAARQDMDSARSQLINRLASYQGYCGGELIIVFDAYKVKGAVETVERHHNINVVYTKERETADMYIEKVCQQLASHRSVRVATSDSLEQIIILGKGAKRISAEAFHSEVMLVEETIKAIITNL